MNARRRRASSYVAALLPVAALLVAGAGSASARDPWVVSNQTPDSWWLGFPVFDPYGMDPSGMLELPADATGGAIFDEVLGGDAAALAGAFGFEVGQIGPDVHVAWPTELTSPFDAILFCSIVNGEDPHSIAEPDFFVRPPEGSQRNGIVLPSSFGRSQFERQPALTSIHARAAQRTATGGGVLVAVLDTGVDATHPYLAGRVLQGFDFVDDDGIADEGAPDGIDQDGDGAADDGFGHGTSVAGLVLGAAPNAKILPVRVLDTEARGTAASLAAAIRWAAESGADVINMSLGAVGSSTAVLNAIQFASSKGVVLVAASGNVRGAVDPEFPARVSGVIAATGNPGVPGDVWAPAVNVAGPYPQARWYRGRGTSFGAALVSGGVALVRQSDPSADAWDVVRRLDPFHQTFRRLDLLQLVR